MGYWHLRTVFKNCNMEHHFDMIIGGFVILNFISHVLIILHIFKGLSAQKRKQIIFFFNKKKNNNYITIVYFYFVNYIYAIKQNK